MFKLILFLFYIIQKCIYKPETFFYAYILGTCFCHIVFPYKELVCLCYGMAVIQTKIVIVFQLSIQINHNFNGHIFQFYCIALCRSQIYGSYCHSKLNWKVSTGFELNKTVPI